MNRVPDNMSLRFTIVTCGFPFFRCAVLTDQYQVEHSFCSFTKRRAIKKAEEFAYAQGSVAGRAVNIFIP